MEMEIMIKENKVSLWLGFYENADDFIFLQTFKKIMPLKDMI